MLASLRLRLGQASEALALYARVLRIEEGVTTQLHSEERLRKWLSRSDEQDASLSRLALLKGPPHVQAQARSLALKMALLRKGRTIDLQVRLRRSLNTSGSDEKQKLREQAARTYRQIDSIIWGRAPSAEDEKTLARLRMEAEEMEQKLGADAGQPGAQALDLDTVITRLAATLPADGVLLEIIVAYMADPSRAGRGERSYVALVLFPDARIEVAPLGRVADTHRLVANLLSAVRSPGQAPLRPAQALYQMTMAPLQKHLAGRRRLYVVPEGALHLVPWAALHDGKDYLVDKFEAITYLTSARDLLRARGEAPRSPPLVLGAPDFQAGAGAAGGRPAGADAPAAGLYPLVAGALPLPHARQEAERIAQLVPQSLLRLGSDASEAVLRETRAPLLLHIATHGLFVGGPAGPETPAGSRALRRGLTPLVPSDVLPPKTVPESPLSRAALLLSGASHAYRADDPTKDGLLTAQEATEIDLRGTQLVALSACDTGIGAIESRQGVAGLRRAFFIAGAETLVVSLWQVADQETGGLMEQYYRNLRAGQSRAQALITAARAMRKIYAHPYYWAPFIVLGTDAPMRWPQ